MDPISNVDRLVLLLRRRLEERTRQTAAGRSGASAAGGRASTGLQRMQALAAVEGIDDRQLKRALIQNLLADHFGQEMINDAKFQQVVDRVTTTIEDDREGSRLLGRMVRELRASAG